MDKITGGMYCLKNEIYIYLYLIYVIKQRQVGCCGQIPVAERSKARVAAVTSLGLWV